MLEVTRSMMHGRGMGSSQRGCLSLLALCLGVLGILGVLGPLGPLGPLGVLALLGPSTNSDSGTLLAHLFSHLYKWRV